MLRKFRFSRNPAPNKGKQFLIVDLIAAQIYIALFDTRLGGSIILKTFLVLPVIASALFLERYQAVLFSVCSAALYSYIFSTSTDHQPTTVTFALNFLISAYAYVFIGELFRLPPEK